MQTETITCDKCGDKQVKDARREDDRSDNPLANLLLTRSQPKRKFEQIEGVDLCRACYDVLYKPHTEFLVFNYFGSMDWHLAQVLADYTETPEQLLHQRTET